MLRTHRVVALLAIIVSSALILATPASALITGGKDEEIKARGLPAGALPLANLDTRIAWWEGPPFGGGQYHFEYVGETADLQQAIDLFAKVDSDRKQILVRGGQAESFWLKTSDRTKSHPIDWQFTVWIPNNWQHLRDARHGLLPPGDEGDSPLSTLIVHVTVRIDWDAIKVPDELSVVDERLQANGLRPDQGAALKGTVVDLAGTPIAGATITVGKEDGAQQAISDAKGEFLVTKIPAGTHQIALAADGYASKDVYYHEFTETTFRTMNLSLATAARVHVRVIDQNDQPIPGVSIMVSNCRDRQGNHYRIVPSPPSTTNAKGEFVVADVPEGKLKFFSRTREYYYNSVLNEHDTSESPVVLKLVPTGLVKVSVVDADGNPVTTRYMVEINEQGVDPIKGGKVGSWGGSANIGSDGTYSFQAIPAGDYVVTGRPNPGRESDRTEGTKVTIKGGDDHEVVLTAR